MTRIVLAIALSMFLLPALAQDSEEEAETRSVFTSFIQNRLSTPNRQIRISGISGALSSSATISTITVADREGVWLRITNASIDWSRTALVLRQRLEIERLAAEEIEVIRQPLPEEGMPAPEAGGFEVPELPIAINMQSLDVPSVSFGQGVFGLESELAMEGRLRLESGALDTALAIERLDGPGGQLSLEAAYANDTRELDLDLALDEPADGVVANVLDIEGKPPISLSLAGAGPLDELDLSLALDADDERVLDGIVRLRQQDDGLGFSGEAGGPIARLVPRLYRDFFGEETSLSASGLVRDEGGVVLEALQVESAALTLEAAAETGEDGFLTALSLDGRLVDPEGETVVLPVAGGRTTATSADLAVTFGEAGSEEWNASLDIEELSSEGVGARDISLSMGGMARDLDRPEARSITYEVEGSASGLEAEREEIAEALGERIDLDIAGAWAAGEQLSIERAELAGDELAVTMAGNIADYAFNGDLGVRAASIAPFSGLAGRRLSGALDLGASGELRPIGGGFDLRLDGTADDLRIDEPAADSLLAGETTIAGRLARGEEGLTTENLEIANEQARLAADGNVATGAADFGFEFTLSDLALVSEQASGELVAEGRAEGSEGPIELSFDARVDGGSLAGKTLSEASAGFEGTLENEALEGRASADAFLDGVRTTLSADLRLDEDGRRLDNLDFTAGGASASGDIAQNANGLFEGALSVEAADISTAAALFLVEAEGAIEARIALEPQDGRQNAEADASVRGLRAGETELGEADIALAVADLFGVPAVDGTISASDVVAAGVEIDRLRADATRSGQTTDFEADAALANGATLSATGALASQDGGYRLDLETAELTHEDVRAGLAAPASLRVDGEDLSFDDIAVDVAGGRITARGQVADEYDVALSADAVPLSVANAVRPDLELGGTIDGEAAITGPREEPQVEFEVAGDEIAAAALQQAGLSTIAVEATGTTSGRRLEVDARVTSPEGLDAGIAGTVPLGEDELDLDVNLESFPLAVLDAVAPEQELEGRLSGSARLTGALDDPAAEFEIEGSGIGAAPLSALGVSGLDASASGSYGEGAVSLSQLQVDGPEGLSVSASGRLPLRGGDMAVDVTGSLPLALANTSLAERGTQLSGTVSLEARVTGAFDRPSVSGTFSTSGATATDPLSNLRLQDIEVSGGIEGETVTIRSASGALSGGGTVSMSGTVSISAAEGFPSDLQIALDEARYADGDFVVATVSGELTVTGALARDPLIAGEIDVARAEITVPENLGGGGAADIDVRHIAPPPRVQETLRRARADDGTPVPSERPSVARLDINVNAPARIFVRGRGLDAELGGSVRLTGPITGIRPVGSFDLVRGRLSILGQRINFEEGSVTLVGDLDPRLDFVATSQGSDITVYINVRGRVSDLDISFSSQPDLPEDEVLARLIFDRGVDDLSPLQLAQLAAAAAELAGGSQTSLLGNLRDATGLDDLDIVTDSEGNAAVRAGRYVRDNVYLGVEAGAEGRTRGTINLDITEQLRARGAVGSDGESNVGVFFEKDY